MAAPYRLRGHKPTSRSAASGILGPVLKTYRIAANGQLVIAAVPFVLLLAYGVWLGHEGRLLHWFNSTFSVGAVATLFLCSTALIVKTAAGGGAEVIRLHADGLLDLRAGPRAVRWDEIEALTPTGPDAQGVRRHILRSVDGATLSFGPSIGNVEDLLEEIRLRMVERELPAVRARIDAGDTVSFGAMTATPAGLAMGERVLPWDQVGELEAEGGRVVVRTRVGKTWATAELDEVPNAFLLAEIAPTRRS